jgi:hypothetical protein
MMTMHFTDWTGLTGIALVLAAVVIALPWFRRLPRLALAGGVMVLVLIPFGELPAAAYVRGVVGDLSITTVWLALYFLLPSQPSPVNGRGSNNLRILRILILCAAVALYPMALGISYFDPYRLGYGNLGFLGGLLLVTLFCLYRRHTLAVSAITLAVLAWSAGWAESTNLWDYLLDPLVALYALVAQSCFSFKMKATMRMGARRP